MGRVVGGHLTDRIWGRQSPVPRTPHGDPCGLEVGPRWSRAALLLDTPARPAQPPKGPNFLSFVLVKMWVTLAAGRQPSPRPWVPLFFHAHFTPRSRFAAAAPSSLDRRYIWERSSPFTMTGRRLPSGATWTRAGWPRGNVDETSCDNVRTINRLAPLFVLRCRLPVGALERDRAVGLFSPKPSQRSAQLPRESPLVSPLQPRPLQLDVSSAIVSAGVGIDVSPRGTPRHGRYGWSLELHRRGTPFPFFHKCRATTEVPTW
jgi:hypothetical protein